MQPKKSDPNLSLMPTMCEAARAVNDLRKLLIHNPTLLDPSAFLKPWEFRKTRRLLLLYLHPDKNVTNEKAAASAFIRAQKALKIFKGAVKKDLVLALVEWKRRLKRDDAFAAMAFTATKVVKHEKPTKMTSGVLHPIVVAPINDEEGDRAHQAGGKLSSTVAKWIFAPPSSSTH